MRSSTLRSIIPLSLLAAAGLARAQCTWFIPDVPDFDQKRPSWNGVPGLPGDGGMYCVPTSFTNWFAYVANRGIPQPNGLDGPRDWENNSNYDHLTGILTNMGILMDTHPQDGTKGQAVPGAKLYAWMTCNGDLVISGIRAWGNDRTTPTPDLLLSLHNIGCYTAGTYGFYGSSTGGTRDGGHAISFTGVWDLGCGQAPILQFSDPADDGYNTTQSEFRTSLAALTAVTGNFRPKAGEPSENRTFYRLDVTNASHNFLDAIYCILPTAAIFGGSGTDAGELQLVRPFRPTGNPAPANVAFNKPAGTGPVLDVAMSLNPLFQYYITAAGASQSQAVWRLNITTGNSTRISSFSTTGFNPTRLMLGRHGDLYLIDSGIVRRYDTTTVPMTALGSYDPGLNAAAIAYDDKNDTVAILTTAGITGRQLHVFPRTLSGFGSVRSVPDTYSGTPYIQPDAETAGAYFICSDGSGVLRRYVGQGNAMVETDSILHFNAGLSALNVTDANRLVYAVNGVLVEKEKNGAGTWVNRAGSRWAGRAADGSVSMARSRDDFDASIMSGPEFNNVANPTLYPSLPTCYANCDNSTTAPVLNVLDFACFLNKFAAGNVYANCDYSTTPPILNVLDFACFLNRFAAGCP